jgi:hypothetical protein
MRSTSLRPMRSASLRPAIALVLAAGLAGCGKSLPSEARSQSMGANTVTGQPQPGASAVATKNTTRLGGANPVADAAAVALATYPGLTPATRPQAVVLVDDRDWTAALAAAALAGAPLRAPLLYSEGASLPAPSAQALAALKPTGAAALGGAQAIAIGPVTVPAGYRPLALRGKPTALAAGVERLLERLQGGAPKRVIVVGADGPPALAMPAAGLAAESGTPILPVDAAGVPPATRLLLARLRRPTIYAVGPPTAVSHGVLSELARLGPVRRIHPAPGAGGPSGPGTSGADPADNAIAVARFSDGSFGWGVDQPGHGLVFASALRPLDAPAAAPLSASGDYAPLLLLEAPGAVPKTLSEYLSDIQPAYGGAPEYQPVRGAYNHGWLIGDDAAIGPTVQAELDTMLEISPQKTPGASAEAAPASGEQGEPASPSATGESGAAPSAGGAPAEPSAEGASPSP